MAEITASLVKELREKTGAGMMDCKRALSETAGDLENAVDWLRKKGLAAAAKKAGRTAAEGLIGVAIKGNVGAMVEVNAETDFVARNDTFQKFVATVAELALTHVDLDRLKLAPYPGGGRKVEDELTHLIATVGENMSIRRMARLHVPHGVVMSYVHNAVAPNLGKIGVLVALESTAEAERLGGVGRQIAMHVAAATAAISRYRRGAEGRSRPRARCVARAGEDFRQGRCRGREDGRRPAAEILRRDRADRADLRHRRRNQGGEDRSMRRPKSSPRRSSSRLSSGLVLGEGIEKEATDFAAEVAATLKPN